MTSKITVDAHAGWDIQVVQIKGEPSATKEVVVEVVPANEKCDFYIHSGLRIVNIEELPRNDK